MGYGKVAINITLAVVEQVDVGAVNSRPTYQQSFGHARLFSAMWDYTDAIPHNEAQAAGVCRKRGLGRVGESICICIGGCCKKCPEKTPKKTVLFIRVLA
jgi:hypothetical protein